jgi:hypothetical protein
MCEQCAALIPVVKLKYEYEYFDLLEQLRKMLRRRSLKLVDASCDLDEVKSHGVWSGDVIEHVFDCTKCGQHFRLIFETYHLSGGTWEPSEHPTTWLSRFEG